MKRVALVVVAACGHASSVVAPAPVTRVAPPPVTVAAPHIDGMRFDRPPEPLGLGRRWMAGAVDAMVFCPGDAELATAGGDTISWISAVHGRTLRAVHVDDASTIDCRADGTVLTVANDDAVLIDHDGHVTHSPPDLHVTAARFAADGSVRLISAAGYDKWTPGGAVEHLLATTSPAFLVDGGDLVYVHDGALWQRRGASEIRRTAWTEDMTGTYTSSPDGVLAAVLDGEVVGWLGKQRISIISADAGGRAVEVNKRWFVALDTENTLWTFGRADRRYEHLSGACSKSSDAAQMALSHDGKVAAVACGPVVGIRVIDLASMSVVAGRNPQPLVNATWSGDRLATRDADGTIQIWRANKLVTTIHTDYDGTALWWWGNDLVGDAGMAAFDTVKWSSETGKHGKPFELGLMQTASTKDLTLLATWGPDGFAIQRGDRREPIAYTGHKTVVDLAVSPDGTRGLALRRFSKNTISSPEGLTPDLVVLDLVAKTSSILPLVGDVVAASNTELAVATGTTLAHLTGEQLVPFATSPTTISALAYSLDGRVLAVGGEDGTIAIYAGAQVVATLRGHARAITRLVWNDTQLLSIATDQALVWSLADPM